MDGMGLTRRILTGIYVQYIRAGRPDCPCFVLSVCLLRFAECWIRFYRLWFHCFGCVSLLIILVTTLPPPAPVFSVCMYVFRTTEDVHTPHTPALTHTVHTHTGTASLEMPCCRGGDPRFRQPAGWMMDRAASVAD